MSRTTIDSHWSHTHPIICRYTDDFFFDRNLLMRRCTQVALKMRVSIDMFSRKDLQLYHVPRIELSALFPIL